jgi:Zn-dependent M16 (insulinase) family peptidase
MTTQLKKQLLPWESKVFSLKTLKSVRKLYMIHFKNQVEFSAKRTKDHFGLACLSHMVPYALHGGDPLSIFKINEYS